MSTRTQVLFRIPPDGVNMLDSKCKTAALASALLYVTEPQVQTWLCLVSSEHMPDPGLAKNDEGKGLEYE